jgi:hypothetical protein
MHAQSPRNIERCAELGRYWPSSGEPAFPRNNKLGRRTERRKLKKPGLLLFYLWFIFRRISPLARPLQFLGHNNYVGNIDAETADARPFSNHPSQCSSRMVLSACRCGPRRTPCIGTGPCQVSNGGLHHQYSRHASTGCVAGSVCHGGAP